MNNEQKINLINEIIDEIYDNFRETNNIIFENNNSTKEEIKECIVFFNNIVEEHKKTGKLKDLIDVKNQFHKLFIAIKIINFYCEQKDISQCKVGKCKLCKSDYYCYSSELLGYLRNLKNTICQFRLFNDILSIDID